MGLRLGLGLGLGSTWLRFCAMSETMYSLFHRNSARSATCKGGLRG